METTQNTQEKKTILVVDDTPDNHARDGWL